MKTLTRFLFALLVLSQAAATLPPTPPAPKAPRKPVLTATRQGIVAPGIPDRSIYVAASKLIGGTNYEWCVEMFTTNVAKIVTVRLTNAQPSRPVSWVSIRHPVQTSVLKADDLNGTWTKILVTATNEIRVPNTGKQGFYKLQLPDQECVINWEPSTSFNVSSYTIKAGTESGYYTMKLNVGLVTNYVATALTPGMTYYFTVTASDVTGRESALSNETVFTAPEPTEIKATLSGIE